MIGVSPGEKFAMLDMMSKINNFKYEIMVKQKTLIIWGENDQIIDDKLAVRLHCELPNAIIRQIPDCGHIPHVEKPTAVSKLITEFVQAECKKIDKQEFILS
ncbi:2-hydroxy-6-oxonona-2,4-dienedioate hydrolase [Handroanthus impetiginosus]|uniref:2-hydroxy-6-oxonona-2,4-dienedioate hydrolase n=1 Tax=Handroanthus impetiginosus TaxID=429701 RepID=A0A2G9GCT2_9LAMI|nr:2-hydroxy-6-oxonona-2,4-dienedioate hydrolase [Handroanthus impetiginosus]